MTKYPLVHEKYIERLGNARIKLIKHGLRLTLAKLKFPSSYLHYILPSYNKEYIEK
jgi:hypothetical protein